MKQFKAEVSKEVIATFEIDGNVFNALGGIWSKGIAPFLQAHPEYKDAPYEGHWKGNNVVYSIFSIGNITIVEK